MWVKFIQKMIEKFCEWRELSSLNLNINIWIKNNLQFILVTMKMNEFLNQH